MANGGAGRRSGGEVASRKGGCTGSCVSQVLNRRVIVDEGVQVLCHLVCVLCVYLGRLGGALGQHGVSDAYCVEQP